MEYFPIPAGRVHSRRNKLVVSYVIFGRNLDTISSPAIATLAAQRRQVVFSWAVSLWLWLFRSVDTAHLPVSLGLNVGYGFNVAVMKVFFLVSAIQLSLYLSIIF